MRVIGIDPGLIITGYGVIEEINSVCHLVDSGSIRPPKEEILEERIYIIYEALSEVIERNRPEVMILEELYSHYKHPTTAILMGHIRGAICLLARLKKIPVVGYSATMVKKSVTGSGNATKTQVQRMVQNLLDMQEALRPLDISDALALAITHTHRKGKEA